MVDNAELAELAEKLPTHRTYAAVLRALDVWIEVCRELNETIRDAIDPQLMNELMNARKERIMQLDRFIRRYHVRLEFSEALLGTVPLDENIFFYAGDPQPDEKEALQETLENADEIIQSQPVTGFLRRDERPCLMNHVIAGYCKETCGFLRRLKGGKGGKGTESSKLSAYKKIINGHLFVEPRFIPIMCDVEEVRLRPRSLRASTPRGERQAIVISEEIPAGSWIEFDLILLGDVISETLLREWLEYGQFHGLGQWRNAGFGRFSYQLEAVDGK